MPKPVAIVIQQQPAPVHDWYRFVAALCFMEFYVTLVYGGVFLWAEDTSIFFYGPSLEDSPDWLKIGMMLGAVMLYLTGRGLWFARRAPVGWLWLGISGCATLTILDVASFYDSRAMQAAGLAPASMVQVCLNRTVGSVYLILLVLLIMGLWWSRPTCRLHRTGTASWVYFAAAFCVASLPSWFLGHRLTALTFVWAASQTTGNPGLLMAAHGVNVILLVGAAAALLTRRRWARTIALGVATMLAVGQWYAWYPISMLVRVAIRVALMSRAGLDYTVLIVTQFDFVNLLVLPVREIGPWLLIGWWAWRRPMNKPPEDDSPYPRYFCGHCSYNLHGTALQRCPECGAALAMDHALPSGAI